MDDNPGKRVVNGVAITRKGSSHVFRDMANSGNQHAQVSITNGYNCSSSSKGKQVGCSEKGKTSRHSLRSSNGKEIFGSSSKVFPAGSKPKKAFSESRKLCSHVETSSEASSNQHEPEASELIPPPGKIQKGLQPEPGNGGSGKAVCIEAGSSSVALNTRSRRNFNNKPGVAAQHRVPEIPSASNSASQMTRGTSSRYGLRSLKCNSVSDVVPSGSSSSDPSLSNRKSVVKKRNSEGESSSSAKGKGITSSSSFGRNSSTSQGISIPETGRPRSRHPNNENGCASSNKRRPSICSRSTPSIQGSGNTITNDSHSTVTSISQPEVTIEAVGHISSHQVSTGTSNLSSTHNRPSTGGLSALVSVGAADTILPRRPISRASLRDYNLDGIEEVLLELERIQQEAELTFEQILEVDAHLLFSRLNFFDRFRDMRLDIDNMSYEELLALEERIGTVNTALSEESLSKCLKRSVYQLSSEDGTSCSRDNGDVKCSICQEEYVVEEEVGQLNCNHRYHVHCIHQWLRLKNWCPICKAPAEPSQSATPL